MNNKKGERNREKNLLLLAWIMLCSGCAIHLPLTGNLDGTTTANLQAGGLRKASLGYFVDPETRSKELERYTDGKYAGGRAVIIPIGQALSNALYQGLKNSYDEVRWVDRPDPPSGSYLVKIRAEQMDAGFEFSAVTAAYLHKMAPELLLDKARVSLSLRVEILPPDASKKPLMRSTALRKRKPKRRFPRRARPGSWKRSSTGSLSSSPKRSRVWCRPLRCIVITEARTGKNVTGFPGKAVHNGFISVQQIRSRSLTRNNRLRPWNCFKFRISPFGYKGSIPSGV